MTTDRMSHHAHDLFDLVASRPEGWTFPELQTAVSRRFGEAAQFHTCSMSGMNLEALIEFATTRGKLNLAGGRLFGGVHTCGH